jgi:hypothetical protein
VAGAASSGDERLRAAAREVLAEFGGRAGVPQAVAFALELLRAAVEATEGELDEAGRAAAWDALNEIGPHALVIARAGSCVR